MDTAEERFELIERYLRQQLGPDERAAFEAAVAADPELAAAVQRQRMERRALELLVEGDLLAKMQQWDSEAPAWTADETPTRSLADWRTERETFAGRATPRKKDGLAVTFKKIPVAVRAAAAAVLLAVAGWLVLDNPFATPGADDTAPIARTTEPAAPSTPGKSSPTPTPSRQTPATRPSAPSGTGRQSASPRPAPTETTRPGSKSTTEPAVTQRQPAATPTPAPAKPAATAPAVYASLASEYYREGDFRAVSSAPSGGSRSGLDKLQSEAFGKAAQRFQGRSYGEVEKLLAPIVRLNPNATSAREMLAHALYRQGRYRDALPYFRQLAGGSGAVAERAQWAAVLTAMHDMPRQQRVFDTMLNRILSRPGHAFYDEAKRLDQRLGNR